MIQDGRNLSENLKLQSQFCVIGAGAASITLALELAHNGADVILLEAGNHA
ncbi:MAG: NAD(P)-binding protein [Gammaproteobacteria bacterium]